MSILIKGMDMPKNCVYCPMSHWDKLGSITGCEIVAGKKFVDKEDRDYWLGSDIPKWCPLVEIPTPHGRLIDADKLIQSAQVRFWGGARDIDINKAPTLIESEE